MNKQLKQTVHSSALKGSVVLFLVVVAACFLEGTKINESFKSQAQADFNINLIGNGMNFNHFWKRSVGSCHATFCLRADWREQLKLAQKELGFTGIRFHGIFNDDMSVILQSRHDPKVLQYSFYNVDQCYDFLVGELKMKPIIELSFMPELIASDPSKTIFHYKGGISPPKSMNLWNDLIKNFVSHLIERYGIDEVSSWHFEVWNEPNLKNTFWTGTQQDYFNLYNNTAVTIKSIDKRLKVGGPATAGSSWIQDFINFVKSNNVPYDFVSTHEYPTDIQPLTTDTLIKVAKQTKNIVGSTPLFYTEWNSGLNDIGSGTYFYQDSAYPAALVPRTLFSVNNIVDVYSYWTFTDLFEEHGQYSEVFQENFGMMSIYGIRKPVWRAFELMGKTGNELFNATTTGQSTVNIFATLNRQQKEVMIFASNYQVPTQQAESYMVSINVQTLSNALHNCKTHIVDETRSNAFTKWKQIGSPTYPTKSQLKELHDASTLFTQNIEPKGTSFVIQMENPSLHVIVCNV